jgi:hypothetical protein
MAADMVRQFQPGLPTASQLSYSAAAARSQVRRFRAEVPPRTRPRGVKMARLLRCGCGTVVKFQSYLPPRVEPLRPGTLMPSSWRADGPASMMRMLAFFSFWLRRVARALPAVPPPTMIFGDQ